MAKRNQIAPKSFEEALAELEQILADVESSEVTLEDSLIKYERGQFLIAHCRVVLEQAEKQIEILSKTQGGQLQATPQEPTGQEQT